MRYKFLLKNIPRRNSTNMIIPVTAMYSTLNGKKRYAKISIPKMSKATIRISCSISSLYKFALSSNSFSIFSTSG